MTTRGNTQRDAISRWHNEGGATPSRSEHTAEQAQTTDDRQSSERNDLDASHDSAVRGEHRYPDAHQTPTEQRARQLRDDLKRRLTGSHDHPRQKN
jgi:hypothetical protein